MFSPPTRVPPPNLAPMIGRAGIERTSWQTQLAVGHPHHSSFIAVLVMSPPRIQLFISRPAKRSLGFFCWGAMFLSLTTAIGTPVIGTPAQAETWTNLRGTASVEARMIGMWNGNVVLEMDGSRRVTVPLDALRSESRIQAQELWQEIQRTRGSRVEELAAQASAAAAPAPNPIPKPAPAAPYQKPVANAKVADFLQNYDEQVAAGHYLLARFDVLPPSYRNDIDEIVKLAAAKIDPATWHSVITSLHELGDLVVTRQNWFFSSPRLADLPPEDLDLLQQKLLLVAGMLSDGFQPDAWQLDKFQSMDLGQWLAERDQAIAPYLAALMQQQDVSAARHFGVVSETADAAQVKMSQATIESNVKLAQVEGYWVPESVASTWAEDIASMKIELQKGTAIPQLSEVAMIQLMLQPLASASNERQFHETMETFIAGLEPKLPDLISIAASAGMNMDFASANGRRRGGYGQDDMGYDEMMNMDMGMEEDMQMEEDMRMEMEMQMEEGQRREQQQRRPQ